MAEWWRNPFKWLDNDDLDTDRRGIGLRARVALISVGIYRSTENAALLGLFFDAYSMLNAAPVFTPRQQEAINYAAEALRLGKPPVNYVASALNIRKQSASRLLRDAAQSLSMLTYAELPVYIYRQVVTDWFPDEAAIESRMLTLPHRCAGDGTEGCPGSLIDRTFFRALCFNCYQEYGSNRAEWEPWLIAEARAVRSEHRKLAIETLYEDYYAAHNSGDYWIDDD